MVPPPIVPDDPRLGKERNNVAVVLDRRETWDNYQDLTTFLQKRSPWKTWDPRVFDLYLVSSTSWTTRVTCRAHASPETWLCGSARCADREDEGDAEVAQGERGRVLLRRWPRTGRDARAQDVR